MIVFVLGVTAAWGVTAMRRGRFIFDTLFSLPMVLPPTVTGFFLLIIFGKNSFAGELLSRMGISVVFNLKGAVIADAVVSFPIPRQEELSIRSAGFTAMLQKILE